jgi:uncharacterized Tic20 family protein
MTNRELKTKISKLEQPDWFNTIEENFNFHYSNYNNKFIGVSSIYEFVLQQINGWEKLDILPYELQQSLYYFQEIRNGIINFIENYSTDISNRQYCWSQYVSSRINSTGQYPLLFNTPEVDFLLKVNKETPQYFPGSFHTLIHKNISNYSDLNSFFGALLVYEFSMKDFTSITERKNSEKKSINTLRTEFENYLNESEKTLSTHLSNSNSEYNEYVKKIDELKNNKEDEFKLWFDKTKDEDWKVWFEEKTQHLKSLEETYESKLKLEKPAKYWEEKSKIYKGQASTAKKYLIFLISITIVFLTSILLIAPDWIFTNVFKGNELAVVRWSLIFIVLISIIAFSIKALTKYMFSSYHLARDAEERHTLTFFYLSLLKDTEVKDEERQMILQSLFSRTDTGLLKEDSSPTLPTNEVINKIINK